MLTRAGVVSVPTRAPTSMPGVALTVIAISTAVVRHGEKDKEEQRPTRSVAGFAVMALCHIPFTSVR